MKAPSKNSKKTLLLLGGVHGLGREIAALAGALGHQVLRTSRGPGGEYICDLQDNSSIQNLLLSLVKDGVMLDWVVVNPGLSCRSPIRELSLESIDDLVQVNITGPIKVLKALLPRIKPQGRIVFVSSLAALLGFSQVGVYGAAKSAIEIFAQALTQEERDLGLSTGIVYLDFLENSDDKKIVGPGGKLYHHHRKAKMTQKQGAKAILRGCLSRKTRLFPTFRGKALVLLLWLVPPLGRWLARRGGQSHQSEIISAPSKKESP